MSYFIYNGSIKEAGKAVIGPDNRGFRYGDGLFETMKYINGHLVLPDEHFARLWKGMQLMKFEIPSLFSPDLLQAKMLSLLKKNGHKHARARIVIFRGDGGLYEINNNPQYIIQSWPLEANIGKWNNNGLQLGIYNEVKKMSDSFSNCKHNNYLPYFMGALFAKSNKHNDTVILNNHDRICESTIANIFLVKDGSLFTPSLNEGCVAGTIRKFLLLELPKHGFPVKEIAITVEQMLSADEVFLTNSIFNLRWVSSIENKTFDCKSSKEIFSLLSKTNPFVFC